MGAAASNSFDIDQDNDKLRELVADMTEAVTEARKAITTAAKVSSAALGRVKDVFDKLAVCVGEKATAFSRAEMAAERANAAEALRNEELRWETQSKERLEAKIHEITTERDASVKEAREREKQIKEAFEELQNRSENSEELLQASEESLRKAEEQAKKVAAKKKKIDESFATSKEQWAEAMMEILQACTLKAQWEETPQEAKQGDSSKPWRAKQRSVAEQIQKDLDKLEEGLKKAHGNVWMPGEQFKLVVAAYEESTRYKDEKLARQSQEAQDEIAYLKTAGDEERVQLRQQLQATREALETITQESQAKEAKLQQELTNVSKVAKEEARTDAKKLEGRVEELMKETAEFKTALDEMKKEVATARDDLKVQVAAREEAEEKSHSMISRHNQKLAALVATLNDARAAACNGGYYFAAAPTPQKRHSILSISPPSPTSLSGSHYSATGSSTSPPAAVDDVEGGSKYSESPRNRKSPTHRSAKKSVPASSSASRSSTPSLNLGKRGSGIGAGSGSPPSPPSKSEHKKSSGSFR